MDLSWRRWARDFVVLGGGVGLFAPGSVLAFIAWNNGGRQLGVVAALGFGTTLGGALLGVGVGTMAWAAARSLRDHPLWLLPIGFPLGAIAGGTVGAAIGSFIHPDAVEAVGLMGLITGGTVLGFCWLPYLALKLRGRSGLPWMLAASLLSPLVGGVLMGDYWMNKL